MSNELTLDDSQPIELYEFSSTFDDYYYTSDSVSHTVDSKTYLPINVSRTALKIGTHKDEKDDLDIDVPLDIDVAADWAFDITPPDLNIIIKRMDRANSTTYTIWTGRVASIKVLEYSAVFKCPTRFVSILSANVPTIHVQPQCNHVLFDDRCKVVRASYSYSTTVSSVNGLIVNVASAGTGSNADYSGGELLNTTTGERRTITSKNGTAVTVSYPMRLEVSDNIEITQGCDHSWGALSPQGCAKFNNLDNFGGLPFVPGESRNVFEVGI